MKLSGGREGMPSFSHLPLSHPCQAPLETAATLPAVVGTLKGYDQLLNLVLDEAIEHMRESEGAQASTTRTRKLGLVVPRGTSVMVVAPLDGTEEIANPFMSQE